LTVCDANMISNATSGPFIADMAKFDVSAILVCSFLVNYLTFD